MNYIMHKENSPAVLEMPAEATIESVGSLYALLGSSDEAAEELVVDLAETVTIDVTCLQVLCAAHHRATREGRRLRLENLSLGVRETLVRLGFPRHVGCGDDVTGSCLWLTGTPS